MLQYFKLLFALQIVLNNIRQAAGIPVALIISESTRTEASDFGNVPIKRQNIDVTRTIRRRSFSEGFSDSFSRAFDDDSSDVLAALSPQPTASSAAVSQDGTLSINSKAVMDDIQAETKTMSTSIMDSINKIVASIFDSSDSVQGSLPAGNVAQVDNSTSTSQSTGTTKVTNGNSDYALEPQSSSSTSRVPQGTPSSYLMPSVSSDLPEAPAAQTSNAVQDTPVSNAIDTQVSNDNTTGYAVVPITANGVQGVAILPVGNSSLASLISSLTSSAAAPVTNAAAAVLPTSITQPTTIIPTMAASPKVQQITSASGTTNSTALDPNSVNQMNAPDVPLPAPTTIVTAATTANTTTSANNFSNGSQHTVNKTPSGTGAFVDGQADTLEAAASNPDGVRIDGALSTSLGTLGSSIVINMGSSTTPSAGSIRIVA